MPSQSDPIANKTEIRSTEEFFNVILVDQGFQVGETVKHFQSLDGSCWCIEMIVLNASK